MSPLATFPPSAPLRSRPLPPPPSSLPPPPPVAARLPHLPIWSLTIWPRYRHAFVRPHVALAGGGASHPRAGRRCACPRRTAEQWRACLGGLVPPPPRRAAPACRPPGEPPPVGRRCPSLPPWPVCRLGSTRGSRCVAAASRRDSSRVPLSRTSPLSFSPPPRLLPPPLCAFLSPLPPSPPPCSFLSPSPPCLP